MREIKFGTLTEDELAIRHDSYWRGALAGLRGAELGLDADEPEQARLAEPVSFVMPYRAAMERYSMHVRRCAVCTEQSFTEDNCDEGHNLAHLAAEAMATQEEKAALN